jgi:hypothetical protein
MHVEHFGEIDGFASFANDFGFEKRDGRKAPACSTRTLILGIAYLNLVNWGKLIRGDLSGDGYRQHHSSDECQDGFVHF